MNNETNPYPRDMRGYGRNTPDPKWPNKAKIAVQFVVNYEEGGENNILHGDAASEAFLSEIVGAAQWPGQRHANMESIYDKHEHHFPPQSWLSNHHKYHKLKSFQ